MPSTRPPAVTGLLIDPEDDVAYFCHIDADIAGIMANAIGGHVQALELDGGAVLWLDDEGKAKRLPTNLLATKVAHRLHAGLYPDDTINGRAFLLGERLNEHDEPVSSDLGAETYSALIAIGVEVQAQASQEVLLAAGGAWGASLNHFNTGGGCMVTTQQVDERMYVVGQDDYAIAVYTAADWLGESDTDAAPDIMEAESALDAWDLLRQLREDCLLWHCESCTSWLHTTNVPTAPIRCATCGGTAVTPDDAPR